MPLAFLHVLSRPSCNLHLRSWHLLSCNPHLPSWHLLSCNPHLLSRTKILQLYINFRHFSLFLQKILRQCIILAQFISYSSRYH